MKIRKPRATLALIACLGIAAASAQTQGSNSVFSPFPSRLRAAVKDNLVILTWTDSPDLKGRYVVYRSSAAPSSDNLASAARLGEVASGAQTYTDTPPDSKPYYYAVLALADDASPYQVFIPAKNTTTIGISVAQANPAKASPPAAEASAPSATSASPPSAPAAPVSKTPAAAASPTAQAFVSGLTAKVKGDAIVLSYRASPKSRLVLYRGSMPLSEAADLLDATLIAAFTDKDGSFADFPVPGVDYYYAILGEEDLKAGRISLAAGANSLTGPVQVRAAAISAGFAETPPASRTPPLPYFLMEDGSAGGGQPLPQDEGPPPSRPVSPETEKAISALLAKAPHINLAMPTTTILPEELAAPSGGEDYALSLIVADRIAAKDWVGASDQLRKYLSLNRGPRASARAHFYLGEALAFKGSGREAFFEFLSARDFYPLAAKPWIEYVLSKLQEG